MLSKFNCLTENLNLFKPFLHQFLKIVLPYKSKNKISITTIIENGLDQFRRYTDDIRNLLVFIISSTNFCDRSRIFITNLYVQSYFAQCEYSYPHHKHFSEDHITHPNVNVSFVTVKTDGRNWHMHGMSKRQTDRQADSQQRWTDPPNYCTLASRILLS